MNPTALFTALALVALPASAPLTASAQQPPVVATPVADQALTIADQAGFDAAFAADGPLAKLSAATPTGQIAAATLRLANGRYRLPDVIQVPRVHVRITSAEQVDPVGVNNLNGTRPKSQGATLVQVAGEYDPTVVMSPLTVESVHIETPSAGRTIFDPSSELTITNTNVFSVENPFSPPTLVELTNDAHSPKVVIKDSSLDDVLAIRVYKTLGTTHIEGNIFTNQRAVDKTIDLVLGIDHKPVPNTPGSHIIRNNRFNQAPYNTAINAGRPGIRIEHNEFHTTQQGDNASIAITPGYARVFADSRPLLSHIEVLKNRFSGANQPAKAIGLELLHYDSINAQQLLVQGNDFSGVTTGVRVLRDWKSNAPIRFSENYMGSSTNELATDAVASPLAAPPADAGLLTATPPTPPTTPPGPPPVVPPTSPPTAPPTVSPTVPPTTPPVVPPPVAPPPVVPPQPEPKPSPSPSTNATEPIVEIPRTIMRLSGETRFETAAMTAAHFNTARHKTVIVARHDVAADSVSAVPLASTWQAPVVLTPRDQLHPATKAAIQRALPQGGTVVIMGGDQAISPKVEAEIAALGVRVDRIAGVNRAATAVATAQRLATLAGVKEVLVADGTDWQADLIAGPAAAKVGGVTLLTNGRQTAPETDAYLASHPQLKVTAIGEQAAQATPTPHALTDTDPSRLSVQVAKHFFTNPYMAGVATTQDFADALAGGAYMAVESGPLLLTPPDLSTALRTYTRTTKSIRRFTVIGGESRLPSNAVSELLLDTP